MKVLHYLGVGDKSLAI